MNFLRGFAALAAWLCSAVAWADTPAPHREAGTGPSAPRATSAAPARPEAKAPAYRSAFEGYRRFDADAAPADWRAANDTVREVGGHMGIVKPAGEAAAGHGAHHAPKQGARK